MKITMKQAIQSEDALNKLNNGFVFEQGLGLDFAIAGNEIARVMEAYRGEREKLFKSLAKQEDGKPVRRLVATPQGEVLVYDLDTDGHEKANDGVKALEGREVEVNVSTVKLSDLKKEKIPGGVYMPLLGWLIVTEPKPAPEPAAQVAE